ncbi:leucine-rich repeat domain-containing protein [Denitrobacterium detoxificans]|uniref:leucine-rich repeat domain-containing protein n=1 Tax=Denitrobacterium detoxificans TaxID=79604 RepID=UPI0026EE27BE|nr:leucine-rich repeat domain-containing protein [Denitrobacterium detoxificans]MBE6465928.1 leucine-rich repeat domain-containing protein [Denitrobacterium detoxificans]
MSKLKRGVIAAFVAVFAVACLAVGPVLAHALSTDPTYDWYTPGQDSYTLSSVGDVRGFANLVNGTADVNGDGTPDEAITFEGATVTVVVPLVGDYGFGGISWTPIGSVEHPFLGSFDGGSNVFDGFRICAGTEDEDAIDRASYLGFFGYVGGSVSNVAIGSNASLVAVNHTAPIDHVGMVAGYVGGSMVNCSNAASVAVSDDCVQTAEAPQTASYIGGLAGVCVGSVSGCANSGALSVSSATAPETDVECSRIVQCVGGVVGFCGDETRMGSSNAPIEGDASKHGSVSGCVNTAQITIDTPSESGVDRFGSTAYARSEAVGGIVGYSQGSVSNCVNGSKTVASEISNVGYLRAEHGTAVGGIVGSLRNVMSGESATANVTQDDGNESDPIELSNCVNYGDLYGLNCVGGIAGATGTYTTVSGCMDMYKTYVSGDTAIEARTYVIATRWNKPGPAGIVGSSHGDICYCANFATVMSATWNDEAERTVNVGSGYYASGIAGFLTYYHEYDYSIGDQVKCSPVPECYACYNAGTIIANSNMRQRGIVGDNEGYTHDCVLLSGVVENDDMIYGDDAVESEVSGSVSSNKVMSADDLRASGAIAALNACTVTSGWDTYWVSSNGDEGDLGANLGYPMLSWNSPWSNANDISAGVAVTTANAKYTGSASVPTVSVTLAGEELTQNVDYYVEPQQDAIEIGEGYMATVHGIGQYEGTISNVAYGIEAGSIADCTVVIEPTTYNFEAQPLSASSIKVTCGGSAIDPSEYRVTSIRDYMGNEVPEPVNARTYTVTLAPVEGSVHFVADETTTADYTIKKLSLVSDCEFDNATISFAGQTYPWVSSSEGNEAQSPSTTLPYAGGASIHPTFEGLTCTVNGVTHELREGYEYYLKYGSWTDGYDTYNTGVAGGTTIGCVTVQSTWYADESGVSVQNFSNYVNMFFNITDSGQLLDLSYATYEAADQIYDGTAYTPATLYYNGVALVEGRDYEIAYSDNVEIGTASFVATGMGSYTGTLSGTFQIIPGTLYDLSYDYDDETLEATVTGVLVYSQRYDITVEIPGTVEHDGKTYVVTAIGDNAFSTQRTRLTSDYDSITPEMYSLIKIASVSVPASVKTIGDYAFYIERGSFLNQDGTVKLSFESNLQSVTFAEGSQLTSIGSYAFSGCLHLATFTFPPYVDTLGRTAFGTCSSLKSLVFETKSDTLPSNIYEGVGKGAFNLCENVVVTCSPNAKAVINLVAGNSDKKTRTNGGRYFTLAPFSIESANIVFDDSSQVYTGEALEPEVTVDVDGVPLALGQDYTLDYVDNVEIGTAKVVITGMGDYEGTAQAEFQIMAAETPMYRLYNPNGGEHFYTAVVSERDNLQSLGWNYEGVGWMAPSTSNTPVYRLYNPNGGDHHYTMSVEERDWLVGLGWRYEGIGWYSDDAKATPLYREYNPNALTGSHNYTTSKDENDNLVRLGWNAEGIAWYGL